MTSAALDIPSVKDKVSPEEWAARVDLAAAYRLVSLYGWEDLVFTHISLRVPGTEDQFNDAFKESSKINQNLHLFEIVTGDNDLITGPATKQLESQLRALNIEHVYTVLPGTHSMFVWRPALSGFLQKLFRR